jgi:sugar phosphate isomerase/epimerase
MELGVTGVMLPELDFQEQIKLCVELGVKYYQYRPRVIAEQNRDKPFSYWGNHKFDLTPQRLVAEGAELTRHLRQAGLEPWGTVPLSTINSPDDVLKLDVEGAVLAQAKCMRCNPPPYPLDQIFDYDEYLKKTIERYAQVVEKISRPAGIKLIIETHQRSGAASPTLAWNLCRHFPPGDVAALLDLANFSREGEIRANLGVSILRSYIDSIHIGGGKRVPKEPDQFGSKQLAFESCAMQEGDLHMPTWLRAVRDAGLSPPLIIEDYSKGTSPQRLAREVQYLHSVLIALI